MKKFLFIIGISCFYLYAFAQAKAPKWMDKQKKAVVTITTYKADGTTLHKGTGFFVSEDGKLLSSYTLFKDAQKAVVTTSDGKNYPIDRVLAADELYDVIRLQARVGKKVDCLELADAPLAVGEEAYLMPFVEGGGKVKAFGNGKVEEASKLKDAYHYYKLSFPLEMDWPNAPVLNADGKVFGLAQEDASGKNDCSYAVSAAYANSLQISSTAAFSETYTNIGIRKAWPADREQARVATYIIENTQDAKTFLETLNDFVATFPDWSESYLRRGTYYAQHRGELGKDVDDCLRRATDDLDRAIELAERKSEAMFAKAQLVYQIALSDSTLQNPQWNANWAQVLLTETLKEEDRPIYHQLQADMYLAKGDYASAYNEYMIVNQSDAANGNSWYMAAKTKAAQPGFNMGEIIQLLDSAVACCGDPVREEAAPYILDRIDWRLRLRQYAEAVADYDLYYKVVGGRVDDNFYYYREQAKFRLEDFEGALADIWQAISFAPEQPIYPAEEASIYIRLEKYPEAMQSIEKALALAPEFAACYRLRGICYQRTNQPEKAQADFLKAKELGDPAAEKLLK